MFSADLGGYTAPPPAATDPPFQKVALLLHGDGTNGAQNNTFVDSSSNNFTITRTGNVAQGTFSPFSLPDGQWSNYFDGTGDYLTTPDNVALQLPTQDFTIECWVYFSALPTSLNANAIFNKGRTGASDFEYQLVAFNNGSNTIIRAGYGTTGPDLTIAVDSGTNYIQTNTWYHVALTRIGTTAKLWINGVNVGTTSSWASTQYSGSGALGIGATNAGGGAITGYLSNVRIVKGTAVYTSNFTPSTTPLTAISGTSLLTCQSNRFKDNSSNNFTITPTGDTKVTAFSPFAPSAAYDASTNGGSGYFDGSGDYLTLAGNTSTNLSTGNFTVEGWCYITTFGSTLQAFWYVGASTSSSSAACKCLLATDGTLNMHFTNNAGVDIIASSSVAFSLNQWNHIAITRSGNNFTLFLNGTSVATITSSDTLSSNTDVLIGSRYNTSWGLYTNGYISNLRIVKGTAVYTSNFTPPTAPLTAVTNTQLLLNCTNAGIIDNAGKNDIETVGNAQISTSVKKYGTGSMSFNGTTDYLKLPAYPDLALGSGNFTIEAWVYVTNTSGRRLISARPSNLSSTSAYAITVNSNSIAGNIAFFSDGFYASPSSDVLPRNTWAHIAFVRNGTTITGYVNGTSVASSTNSQSFTYSAMQIGADPSDTVFYAGYIDDLRITKGQALYTSNFTPPTQAFPDV